ncbi:acetamidase/formamidase family protein [Streptomyces sp. 5.8]|uniref:acetamidase/formamidase family protein n=1 Tax=Streptomyces sp. 5.8 TaxID=3406571 RepID=UPI003BB55DFA
MTARTPAAPLLDRGQVITHKNVKYALSARDTFEAEVEPGEVFEVDTELNIGGHLITHPDDRLTEADINVPYVNPATGPIRVNGARPGDTLHVRVLDVGVRGLGYTALWPKFSIFGDPLAERPADIQARVVRVEDGLIHWSDTLTLDAHPMIGLVGVAPAAGEVMTLDNGPHGGNLDIQEVTNGSTISFRVHHDGAYLYFGDVHALQGDGESSGMGAVEIRGRLRIQVDVAPPTPRLHWPRIETATHIATTGCARPVDDAMRTAFAEMIHWLQAGYGLTSTEAQLLLGPTAQARCTQMVNPHYTYICKIDKRYLPEPRN